MFLSCALALSMLPFVDNNLTTELRSHVMPHVSDSGIAWNATASVARRLSYDF